MRKRFTNEPGIIAKVKTCFYVLRGWSVVFNTSFYGKVRVKPDNNIFTQNNRYYDDRVTDNVRVFPTDSKGLSYAVEAK
jgi:hypothetical protein